MSTPVKRTPWNKDLSQFRKDHGLSKKVLLNCCLFRWIISWASPIQKVNTIFAKKKMFNAWVGINLPFPNYFSELFICRAAPLLQPFTEQGRRERCDGREKANLALAGLCWQHLVTEGCGPGQDNLLNSKLNVRMGKKGDLSNFERGMVVGARRAGLSISQSPQLLGFSLTTISRVYKEWSEKAKSSSMRQSCGPGGMFFAAFCYFDTCTMWELRRSESDDRRCLATRPLSSDFSSRTSDNREDTEQEFRLGFQDGCALKKDMNILDGIRPVSRKPIELSHLESQFSNCTAKEARKLPESDVSAFRPLMCSYQKDGLACIDFKKSEATLWIADARVVMPTLPVDASSLVLFSGFFFRSADSYLKGIEDVDSNIVSAKIRPTSCGLHRAQKWAGSGPTLFPLGTQLVYCC
ncbi:hypothetical protein F2P79_010394 [Pimephales promelas]|nr:hypothetical protein F2P79_010394 [Pimephales promelas]